MFQILK